MRKFISNLDIQNDSQYKTLEKYANSSKFIYMNNKNNEFTNPYFDLIFINSKNSYFLQVYILL